MTQKNTEQAQKVLDATFSAIAMMLAEKNLNDDNAMDILLTSLEVNGIDVSLRIDKQGQILGVDIN